MLHEQNHVLDYVDDYLHGVMSPDDAAFLERHVESCRICKVGLEEARRRQAALDAVAASEASEQLIQATLRKVDAYEKSWGRYRRYLAPAAFGTLAASVLVLALCNIYYARMAVTPYEMRAIGQNELLA